MWRRFRLRSPYVMGRHPIFQYETRRVRWTWSPARLWSYTRAILIVMHLLALALWLLLLVVWRVAAPTDFFFTSDIISISITIINFMLGLVFLASPVLDFVSLQVALNSINGEQLAGRWDLLRLTALTEHGIVRAKLAGLWLRTWRLTSAVVGARLALIMLGGLVIFVVPYLAQGYNEAVEEIVFGLTTDPISIVLVAVIIVITLMVYVVEPFWRMQSMTALGMVLSAYIPNLPLAMLGAVGAMFAVWLLQAIIVVALVWVLGTLGSLAILAPFFYYTDTIFPLFAYLLFCCIVSAITVYGFYYLLRSWSLRRVQHRLNRVN